MMNHLMIKMKRLFCLALAWLMGVTSFSGATIIGAGTFGATMITSASDAEARSRGRTTSRTTTVTTVRHTKTPRHVARGPASPAGAARRTTRRVVRRHLYVIPRGYRLITRGNYRYYYYSGIYYYPYYISGQTVYVEIHVDTNGNPTAPPPASEIHVDINVEA
jgi:hypothetical protein